MIDFIFKIDSNLKLEITAFLELIFILQPTFI